MSFFKELKRRNVVRVGLAYAVIGWALAQVAEFAVENFGAPDWTLKIFVVFLMLGLPLALFFAWAFEITPEGVKREKDVDRSQSITAQTSRKLDFVIIGVLVFAVGFLLIDKFVTEDLPPAADEIVATQSQSIAVLPFVNMSNDDDHFADGLSEELLNLLAKIPDLKVAGRTSSFVFKGRNEDFQAIGDALNVEHVLEGSVRRSGDTLRVTAQLIKVADGYHVWSETYDRKLEDVFAIQDDVAGAITSELKLRLAPTADRMTSNAEAYALYLQALALSSAAQYSEALDQAQVLLDGAIALDENFAKAYELKASFYWMASAWTLDASKGQMLTYEAAVRALALDPSLPGARSFASTANPDNWSWTNEILALEKLVKAEPNNILALNSFQYDLIEAGYFSDALPVADRMIELEPLSAVGYFRRGDVLYALGRREEARESWARAAEFGNLIALGNLVFDNIVQREDEEAIANREKSLIAAGLNPADARSFVENVRDPNTGKTYLDDWIQDAVANGANFEEKIEPYFWYLAFGYLDDYWAAIERLSVTDAAWTNADTLEQSGMIFRRAEFVAHPKYAQMIKSNSMAELWDLRGAPEHCNKIDDEWVCQ